MAIETFDKQNLNTVRARIQSALDAVGAELGIKLSMKTIRFDAASFSTTLEGQAGGYGDSAAKKAIERAGIFLELDCSEPCQHAAVSGAVLVDFRPRAETRPWVYERGGKQYVTTDQNMRLMWPKVAEEAPEL